VTQPGGNCTAGSNCAPGTFCFNPTSPNIYCFLLTSNCTCNSPLADNQTCGTYSVCSNNSRCYLPPEGNYTCVPAAGTICAYPYDCGPQPMWDCNCDNRCYILNTPTPAPTFVPTPVAPDYCASQRAAWNAVKPPGFSSEGTGLVTLYLWTPGSSLPSDMALFTAPQNQTVAKLVSLLCCMTCANYANRFQASIFDGYQVDCKALTFTKIVQNQCLATTSQWAFTNCWTVSSASKPIVALSLLMTLAVAVLL